MARKVRVDYEGAVHHIWGRGNGKQVVFRDQEDYRRFLLRLRGLVRELKFGAFAVLLMPNHYHLLLRTGKVPLEKLMQRLLTGYTRNFNDKWNVVGHLFEARYKERLCRDDNDLKGLIRYIHRNAVEAGLCARVGDWPWSSHNGILAGSDPIVDVKFVVALFDGVDEYAAFVETKVSQERPTLQALADGLMPESLGVLAGPLRTTEAVALRREFVALAMLNGYRIGDVAKFLGRTPSAVSHLIRRADS